MLNFADHTRAHEILFEISGNLEDKVAYLSMSGHTKESRQLLSKLVAKQGRALQAINRKEQKHMLAFTFGERLASDVS